jgi:hypothetical protein
MISFAGCVGIVIAMLAPYVAAYWIFIRAEKKERAQDEHARERFI